MKKFEKGKIEKIKRFVKRIPLFLAKKAIQLALSLLILSSVIGIIFFYQCNILLIEKELKTLDNDCPLNENNYNKVLEAWEENDLKLNELELKVYDDIFSREIID